MRQLGTDRVLALQFSAGEFTLYLEFYAGGNVVLVGKDGVVVAVLRVVKGVGECKVGAKYEVSDRVAGGDLRTRVVEALETGVGGEDVEAVEAQAQVSGKKFKKKKKKKEDAVRKVLATRMPEFSPTLVEHCLRIVGVDPEIKAEEALADEAKVDLIVKAFEEAEKLVKDVMVDKDGTGIKGYIIAKQPRQHTEPVGGYKRGKGVSFGPSQSSKDVSSSGPSEPSKGVSFGPTDTPKDIVFGAREAVEEEQQVEKIQEDGEAQGMVYSDFFPFLPIQFATDPSVKCLPFTGFNHTVDTFFSSIESQKLTSRIVERELAATKRLADAHASHARRVEGLRDMQELNVLKAKAIEANLDRVEEVITAVNGLVAQGMDWAAMGHLIDGEKKRGNPVAELIKLPLKLFENTVTITLGEQGAADDSDDESAAGSDDGSDDNNNNDDDDDDGEEAPKKSPTETLDIDIDLSLTAYANASLYFTQKKSLLAKESKTLQSSSKALKSTSRKIAADLRKGLKQEKELLCPVRPAVWFEKFLFFISSDGYLVLAGRDLQQNEILYKRYFRRGDVFVSADEQGAAVVLVRNNSSIAGAPVPPGTLGQAGTLAVATSTAWERKSAVAAWWVAYEQVRKTAAGGDYLPAGVFDVSGRKNYLPPAQLVLGYGVLWMVDEEGRKRHGRHRMEEGEKAVPDAVEGKQPDREEDGEKGEDNSGLKTEEQKGEEEEDDEDEEEDEDEEDSDDEEFPDTRIESAGEEEEEEEEAEVKHAPGTESDDEGSPGADLKYQESDPAAVAVSGGKQTTAPPPDTSAHPSGSKHLTAKARRDLKKARISGTSTPNSTHNTPAAASTAHSKHPVPASAPEPARVRGKKGKQKKQATKYAHQDAEDRALAMEVLGSASAAAKTASVAAAAATREAELAAQKARRREQHARAAREGLKAEEARRREAPEEEEEEPEEPVPLDCFVGTPMVGDNILAAIPVCAPWGAMGTFKYKAKMQPGSVKKGKAVKDVVSRWLTEAEKKMDLSSTDMEKAWPRETELVKSWKEAEIVSYPLPPISGRLR